MAQLVSDQNIVLGVKRDGFHRHQATNPHGPTSGAVVGSNEEVYLADTIGGGNRVGPLLVEGQCRLLVGCQRRATDQRERDTKIPLAERLPYGSEASRSHRPSLSSAADLDDGYHWTAAVWPLVVTDRRRRYPEDEG